MKAIRLLFVLTSPVRGGVEEVVLALLRRLDPDEFRLALAAPRLLLDAFGPDLAGLRIDTEDVAVENPLRLGELARLSGVIRRLRPHVVNAHLFRATALAAPLGRWHGARVVETYHGREGWRRVERAGTFLPDRLAARFVDHVIAVSDAARRFLVEGKGYPAAKISVVPNGRDLSVFRPGIGRQAVRRELALEEPVPVVGVVGRLEPQKGHAYLLEAWPSVLREFPRARLLLAGDGSLRAALQAQARALGAAESVIFAGFRPDVPRLLDAVDLLCLPSLYEGMPLTAIEASAMARPVVATAVDGTPEVVIDGETGRLVPPAAPAPLAAALLDLLRDPAGARRMGRAARERALARFDLRRQVEETARVYRRLAA